MARHRDTAHTRRITALHTGSRVPDKGRPLWATVLDNPTRTFFQPDPLHRRRQVLDPIDAHLDEDMAARPDRGHYDAPERIEEGRPILFRALPGDRVEIRQQTRTPWRVGIHDRCEFAIEGDARPL